jgi:transcriptional regulator with XRE-family HTH domain
MAEPRALLLSFEAGHRRDARILIYEKQSSEGGARVYTAGEWPRRAARGLVRQAEPYMSDEDSRLAERVRLLRKRKGWTVAETARRAGLSTSMLWKVENGQTSLTYQKLMRLAKGLEVEVAELFSVEAPDDAVVPGGRRVIERSGGAPDLDFAAKIHHFQATHLARKHYFPIVVDVRARADDGLTPEAHGGEEFAYVIEGQLEFICEGYAPARLQVGDSVYFDASLKHRYVAVDDKGAKMLCVYSAPSAQRGAISKQETASHSRAMQLLAKARSAHVNHSSATSNGVRSTGSSSPSHRSIRGNSHLKK